MKNNKVDGFLFRDVNRKSLIATERKRRIGGKNCGHCDKEIKAGDKYMDVHYFDGFKKASFGIYHLECWTAFLKEK